MEIMGMRVNPEIFKGLRVLVTGSTGFKGSWLCHWLELMGAQVRGFGLKPDTEPSLYQVLGRTGSRSAEIQNIMDRDYLEETLKTFRPELVFHLAAQPLVSVSYEDPSGTHMTNIFGLINLLEVLKKNESVKALAVITSDKCYSTESGIKKFTEKDPLGGIDPYSASKACAEILAKSYYYSFFKGRSISFATFRAGNIIGGGDWSRDRLIPDIVRSLTSGKKVLLRNPYAVRPWQHVLDALSGYLIAAGMMMEGSLPGFDSFNFGPEEKSDYNVLKLAEDFLNKYEAKNPELEIYSSDFHETEYLRLDSSKSEKILGWKSVWNTDKSLEKTAEWYRRFYKDEMTAAELCSVQIDEYINDNN